METLINQFKSFLLELPSSRQGGKKGLSKVSVKNYLSDIRRFLDWLSQYQPQISSAVPQRLSSDHFQAYLDFLTHQDLPHSTISRHFSSLRRFATFIEIVYHQPPLIIPTITSPDSTPKPEPTSIQTSSPNLLSSFSQYLKDQQKSASTVRNYLSDIRHFLAWVDQHPDLKTLPSAQQLDSSLESDIVDQYSHYLELTNTPSSTSSRRLSSLNIFTQFATNQGLVTPKLKPETSSPRLKPIPALSWLKPKTSSRQGFNLNLPSFIQKPITRLTSSPVYRSYHQLPFTPYLHLALLVLFTSAFALFGFRQIIIQSERIAAYPSTPNRPTRQLSFQGRLTDSSGTPIVTPINATFKLWDQETGGTEGTCSGGAGEDCLYSTTTCSVDPDQDGIFNVLLGDGVCGSEIPADVFTENTAVWLEVEVATETLTPRQPIATVAYALNSETVSGIPVSASGSATVNTLFFMNSSGEIVLGEQNPSIVADSGNFTLQGEALTLSTTPFSEGDITIAPDGIGQVNFIGGTTTDDFIRVVNANLTTGSLISGYVGNNNNTGELLRLSSGSSETDRFVVTTGGQTTIDALAGGKSAFIVNQLNSGPIFTASASGTPKFTINNSGTITLANNTIITDDTNYTRFSRGIAVGSNETYYFNASGNINANNLTLSGTTTLNGLTYTWPSTQSTNYVLSTNGSGTLSWVDPAAAAAGSIYWLQSDGAVYPKNATVDLLVGGNSTASAIFSVNSSLGSLTLKDSSLNTLFSVSPSGLVSNVPSSFTSSGNVSFAYDLLLTNQTASSIKSNAPLTIEAGESFESNDLTLKTYNQGSVVIDSVLAELAGGLSVTDYATISSSLALGTSSAPAGTGHLSMSGNLSADGNLTVGGTTTFGSQTYTWPGSQTNNYVLSTNGSGTLSWVDPAGAASGAIYWSQTAGALHPKNATVDLLVGSNASASAIFRVDATTGNLVSLAGAKWMPRSDSTTALNIANAAGTSFVTFDTTNQRVGIGTTSAQYPLDVTGDTRTTGTIYVDAGSSIGPSKTILEASGKIRLVQELPEAHGMVGLYIENGPWVNIFKAKDSLLMGVPIKGNGEIQIMNNGARLYNTGTNLYLQGRNATSGTWQTAVDTKIYRDNPQDWYQKIYVPTTIQTSYESLTTLNLKAITDQTANLQEWQDPAGTALSVVDVNGNLGIGTTSPTEKLDVAGNATVSGNLTFTGSASTIANRLMQPLTIGDSQTGNLQFYSSSNTLSSSGNLTLAGNINLTSGDLQTGGTSRITNAGNLTNIGTTQFNGLTYTWPSTQSSNYVLSTNGSGTLSWVDPASAVASTIYWTQTAGALHPKNATVDLLVGGNASSSAIFRVDTSTGNLISVAGSKWMPRSDSTTALNIANAAGTSFVTFDTTNQRVGIGTTSPSAALHVAGNITSPGVGTNSEKFGLGAVADPDGSLAIGNYARSLAGTGSIAIGYNSLAQGHNVSAAIAIGTGAQATQYRAVAIGTGAQSSGDTSLAIMGSASGGNAIAIGRGAQSAYSSSVAIGYQAVATAAEQFVIGGKDLAGWNIKDMYLGGVTLQNSIDVSINAPGANGTNVAGSNMKLAAGRGTGTGSGGSILFQTANPGSSGTTLNPLTTKMTIAANGNVGIGDASPASLLTVGNGDLFQINSSGRIVSIDGVAHTIDDVSGNLTLTSNSSTISLNDDVTFAGTTTLNGLTYTWPSTQSTNYVLSTNGSGTLSWVDPVGAAATVIYWNQANGSLFPKNESVDLLVGGSATASAKFAFINVNSGTPTASISGTTANVATYLTGEGNLATTNMAPLTIGGSTTGSISLANNTAITGNLTTSGNADIDGTLTSGTGNAFQVDATGNLSSTGTTGITLSGAGADLTFSGTGDHDITASAGTLRFGAATLTGSITGNSQSITGLSQLTVDNLRLDGNTIDTTSGNLTLDSTTGQVDVNDNLNITGSLTVGTTTTLNNITYTWPSSQSTNYVLSTNGSGTLSWVDPAGAASGAIYWAQSGGALYPKNATVDLLIGSSASASAIFRVDTSTGNLISVAGSKWMPRSNSTTALNIANAAGTPFVTFDTLNQRLGIGTSSPSYRLDIGDGSANERVRLNSSGSSTIYLNGYYSTNPTSLTISSGGSDALINNGSGNNYLIFRDYGGQFRFETQTAQNLLNIVNGVVGLGGTSANSSPTLYVNATNVGIGDTTPASLLTVGSGDLFQVDSTGRIVSIDGVAHTIDDVSGNLTLTSNSSTISLNDDVTFAGTTTLNGLTYTWPSTQSTNYVLSTNGSGTLSWVDPVGAAATVIYWNQANGSLFPKNESVDLLIGGSATSSAKFAFINVNSGTPTASISGTTANVATYLTGEGNLQTTNRTNLDLAGTTTGNLNVLDRTGSAFTTFDTLNGRVGIGITPNNYKLHVNGGIRSDQYGDSGDIANAALVAWGAQDNDSSIILGQPNVVNWRIRNTATTGALSFATAGSGTEKLTLLTSGNLGIGDTTPASLLTVGNGDLFQVNSSGIIASIDGVAHTIDDVSGNLTLTSNSTTISLNDNVTFAGTTTLNGLTYTWPGSQTANYVLSTNGSGTLSWVDPAGAASGAIYWSQSGGALYPKNATVDLLIGSNASASAIFRVDTSTGNLISVAGSKWMPRSNSTTALNIANAAGTSFVTFDTTNQRVGIGTSSPGRQFTVAGTAKISNFSGDDAGYDLLVGNANGSSARFQGKIQVDDVIFSGAGATELTSNRVGTRANSNFYLETDNINRVTIETGTGNFGIGTTSPTSLFSVGSSSQFQIDSSGHIVNLGGVAHIIDNNGGNLRLSSNSSTIELNDNVTFAGTTTLNGLTYTWPSTQSSNYVLTTNGSGTLTWSDPTALAASTIYWNQANGAVYPKNATVDLLVGGNSTASAIFSVNSSLGSLTLKDSSLNTLFSVSPSGLVSNVPSSFTSSGNVSFAYDLLLTNQTASSIKSNAPLTIEAGESFESNDLTLKTYNQGSVVIDSVLAELAGGLSVTDYATISSSLALGNTNAAAGPGHLNMTGNLTMDGNLNLTSGALQTNSTTRITNTGNLTNIGTTQFNGLTYTWPTTHETSGYVLSNNGSGTLTWVDANSAASGSIYWTQTGAAVHPKNSTVDLLVGGSATSSAKFAVLNINSGTPTASISGTTANVATYLTGQGNLATTNMAPLTIGGSTTGSLTLDENTTITGNLALSGNEADLTFSGTGNHDITASAGTLRFGAATLTGAITGNSQNITGLNNLTGVTSSFSTSVTTPLLTNAGNLTLSATGANNILFSTNGAERWRVTSTGILQSNGAQTIQTSNANLTLATGGGNGHVLLMPNGTGNVGINNASPAYKLDVTGDINFTGALRANGTAGTTGQVLVSQGTSNPVWSDISGAIGGDAWLQGGNSFGATGVIGTNDNYDLQFETNNTTRMTIDTFGNIGINTTSPTARLDVAGTASLSGTLAFRGTTDPKIDILNGENLGIRTSSGGDTGLSERITVLSNGNIGIGDTTPASLLTIGNGDLFQINSSGRIVRIEGVAHTIDDVSGNLTLTSNSSTISLNDNVTFAGTTTLNGLTYTWPGSQTPNYVLSTDGSGTLTWVAADAAAAGSIYWTLTDEQLHPKNASWHDLMIGGTSTASAKFFAQANTGDGYFSGELGLGTTTPTAKLDIQATPSVYTSEVGNIRISNASDTTEKLYLGFDNNLGTYGSGYVQSSKTGTTWLPTLINPNGGYVGINNTSPSRALHVEDDSGIYVGDGTKNIQIFTSGTDNDISSSHTLHLNYSNNQAVSVGQGGTSNLYVSGSVGIGNTSPISLFSVGSSSQFQVNSSGNIVNLGGAAHSISNVSGNLTINSAGTLVLADTNIQLSGGSTTFDVYNNAADTTLTINNSSATYRSHLSLEGQLKLGTYTATPSGIAAGAVYYDTTLDRPYYFNGLGNWVPFSAGEGGDGSKWTITDGSLHPNNSTLDLTIGGSATSSAAFAFTGISSSTRTATISGNLALSVPTGSAPATSLNILNGGSFNLQTSVGGNSGLTSRLFISNDGKVGIGTTSPQSELHIPNGTIRTDGFVSESDWGSFGFNMYWDNAQSQWEYASNGYASLIQQDGTNGGLYIATATSGTAGNLASWSKALTIDVDGNVGIGTDTPQAKLDIAGASSTITNTSGDITINSASGKISFAGDSLNNFLHATASGQIRPGSYGSDPYPIGDGAIIYRSDLGQLNYYNGTSWQAIGSGSGSSYWSEFDGLIFPTAYSVYDLAVGGDTTDSAKFFVDHSTGDIKIADTTGTDFHTIANDGNNLKITGSPNGSKLILQPDLQINGGDILGSAGATRISLVDTLSLTSVSGFLAVDRAATISAGLASDLTLHLKGAASQTANYMAITSNGGSTGNIFVVDSSGNVGIGTTSPKSKLHLVHNNTTSSATTLRGIHTLSSNSYTGTIGQMFGLDIKTANAGSGTVGELAGLHVMPENWSNSTTYNMYGIWTELENMNSTAVINGYELFLNGHEGNFTNLYGVYQSSAASNNYFAGNVGIGTTSPGAKLHVATGSFLVGNPNNVVGNRTIIDGTGNIEHTYGLNDGSATTNYGRFLLSNNVGSEFLSGTDAGGLILRNNVGRWGGMVGNTSGSLSFLVGGTSTNQDHDDYSAATAMTILSSGYVGIGTTTAPRKLTIYDSSAANTYPIRLINNYGGQGYYDHVGIEFAARNGTVYAAMRAGDVTSSSFYHGEIVFSLYSNGVYADRSRIDASGAYSTISDARFKTNVAPIEDALEKVKQLQGVTYDWTAAMGGGYSSGFIAQQVELIAPELVYTDTNGFKSVNYSGFTPYLVEALKQQQLQIDQQSGKLTNLNAQTIATNQITTGSAIANSLTASVANITNSLTAATASISGKLTAQSLEVGSLKIGGVAIDDYIRNLIAQTASTQSVTTNSADEFTANTVTTGDLTISNASGSAVAQIDNQGNANFQGNISSHRNIADEMEFIQNSYYSPVMTASSATSSATIAFDHQGNLINPDDNLTAQAQAATQTDPSFFDRFISLIVKNLTALNITSRSITTQELVSPLVEADQVTTNTLTTNLIKPQSDSDLILSLNNQSATTPAQLLITDSQDNTVTSIDSSGNATFSGELVANSAKFDSLEVGNLKANQIEGLTDTLSQIKSASEAARLFLDRLTAKHSAQDESLNATAQQLVSTSSSQLLSTLEDNFTLDSDGTHLALTGLSSDYAYFSDYLAVEGTLMTNDLYVENNLITSSISSPLDAEDQTLYLQPTGTGAINLLAGLLILDESGTVSLNGNLIVTGTLESGSATISGTLDLRATNLDNSDEATHSGFGQLLSIYNEQGEQVAGVDASGSAQFNNLTTRQIIIAASQNSTPSANQASTSSNTTIGTATIPAGELTTYIENNNISDTTLIYLTPISDTKNQVLYVKNKYSCPVDAPLSCQPFFTVAINQPTTQDIQFNYWLIQVQ